LDRQLPAREAQGFLGKPLVDAGQLEHDAARLDDGDPVLGRALAGAHAGLGRLLGHRLVREDVDPDLAASADLAGHRDSCGLGLAGFFELRRVLDLLLGRGRVGSLGDRVRDYRRLRLDLRLLPTLLRRRLFVRAGALDVVLAAWAPSAAAGPARSARALAAL